MAAAVKSRQINPDSVVVLREEMADTHGLTDMGCMVKVWTCLESPMYQPHFYELSNKDKRAMSLLNGKMHFPVFEEIPETKKSSERTDIACMVTANKQWWTHTQQHWNIDAYREAIKNELHGERLNVIEHFAKKDWFRLYGHHWQNLLVLPQYYGAIDVIKNHNPLPVNSKSSILEQYKFTFCYENTALPGYCTEKIIDALVAGSIPIYLGDPYILKHMPEEVLLDARKFPTLNDLEEKILSMTPEELNAKQAAGKKWLQSTGQRHRFSNFARQIFKSLTEEVN